MQAPVKQALYENPQDVEPSLSNCTAILTYLRKLGFQRNDLVAHFGKVLVTKHSSRLGNEFYAYLEQVYIAALDTGDISLADRCLDTLKAKFPHSNRVLKLAAMGNEAALDYEGALKIYREMMSEDPGNTFVQKRIIAVHIARGDVERATEVLVGYLQFYPSDTQAWLELADLYIENGEYARAGFCFEELLLQDPHNALFNLRYAEILYTRGDAANLQVARKYFSQSLLLQPKHNARAAIGLVRTIVNLHTHPRAKKSSSQVQLYASAKKMLLAQYEGASAETIALLKRVLEQQNISA